MKNLVYLLLLLLLAAGCGKKEPVRIGFLAGISGRVADLGVAGRNGVMLAVEQRNAAGGIDGRRIELLTRDDAQDPELAKKAVRELLAEKVEVIVGPMTSSIAMAVLPEVERSNTILVSPTVTATALGNKDDNFLRIIDQVDTYASKMARYQYAKLKHRTATVVYDEGNLAYSGAWVEAFVAEYRRQGGKVLFSRAFRSGNGTSFSELARAALAPRPEVVVLVANSVDAAMICQQVRKQKPSQAIGAAEWASTERFIELAGRAAEGTHTAQYVNQSDTSPSYKAFQAAYRERFSQPPGFAGLAGYDAALVVLEAYARRKPGASIKQTIIEIGTFHGAQRQVQIDRNGDARRESFLTEVRDGRYCGLE